MPDKKTYLVVMCIAIIGIVFAVSRQGEASAYITAGALQPFMVKDIEPDGSSDPGLFKAYGNKVYFSATQIGDAYELWVTDGTSGGTHLVKNINPWPGGTRDNSGPINLTVFNSELYFSIDDNDHGRELWKSDGTESGTVMVKDINMDEVAPGLTGDSNPTGLVEMNGYLYFVANDGSYSGLWKTDGTEANTQRVGDVIVDAPGGLTVVGNHTLFFAGSTTLNVNDRELWKSDGTAVGTTTVKDIQTGGLPSSPEQFTAVNNTLFFTAYTTDEGTELWHSDGTETGTFLVKDISPGSDSSYPEWMTAMGGALYFRANDGSNGSELWKSDGTTGGTSMVKDIYPGAGWGLIPPILPGGGFDLTVINNELYFPASDPDNSNELWKSDGTESGTLLVKNIASGTTSSTPLWFTTDGKTLFFTANDGVNGMELWQSDGTETGTTMIQEIYPGNNTAGPTFLSAEGSWLYFSADDGVSGQEPWAVSLLANRLYLPLVVSSTVKP